MNEWRLRVFPPTGGAGVVILRDQTTMRNSGIRMQVTPEGDCREASFNSRGMPRQAGWEIPSLACVQFEYLIGGAVFVPLFYGQVRVGGNPRDLTGENYTLRSLALRLKRAVLSPGFKTPKQAAHLTVRAVIQDVIASGQVADLIQYSETLCPDLGFDCREIRDGGQQTAWAVLEQIQQDARGTDGLGLEVAFGVNPDRRFFCRLAKTDTQAVTALKPNWQPPVAEDPVTAVLWFLGKRPDGRQVTHLSVDATAAAQYGVWVDRQPAPINPSPWETVPGTYELWVKPSTGGVWQLLTPQPTHNPAQLTDGLEYDSSATTAYVIPGAFSAASFTFKPSGGVRPERYVIAGEVTGDGNTVIADMDSPDTSGPQAAGTTGNQAQGWLKHTLYPERDAARGLATLSHVSSGTNLTVKVGEFRPERVNTGLLDRLAKFFYRTPAQQPAEIETTDFWIPADLRGRVSCVPEIGGAYENRVEAWEYRLSGARGVTVAALAGQADEPLRLAQAELIKARDEGAVIKALSAAN